MGYAGTQFHDSPGYVNNPLKPFGPPGTTYCNEEQIVTLNCPEGTEGDPVTGIAPAGTYCGYATQEEANEVALAAAQADAEELRAASPCIEPGNALWAWGRNFRGSLGVGNTQRQPAPVLVGDSELEWTFVRHGAQFGHAIKSDGSLWAWGENFEGQLGLGDQSVWPSVANNRLFPTRVGTDFNWAKVDCGEQCAAGIRDDGTLWTWGYNASGQLGHNDTTNRLSPTQVGSDTDWADVAVGTDHIAVRKTDGTIWAAGANNGCLGDGTTDASSVFIQCGSDADWVFVAVQHTGVGPSAITAGIKSDGTLWEWGASLGNGAVSDYLVPTQIGTDEDWASFSAGDQFAIAIKTDGTIWSCGLNTLGQLGQGDLTYREFFTQIGVDTTWEYVSCGESFAAAKKTDGTLWGWGINTNSELGQGGQSAAELEPVQMGSDDLWDLVAAGFNDVMAFRTSLVDPAPPPETNGVASGGTYSISGGNTIHAFEANGTFTVFTETAMDILYCGGGGGGGGLGGGGAGEFRKLTSVVIPVGVYAVAIPHYALGAFGGEDRGQQGGNVSFNGVTVLGGGAGAGGTALTETDATGADGASGGGGGEMFEATPGDPFPGFPGGTGTEQFDGGDGVTADVEGAGGGGGGATAAGGDGSTSGGGTGGAGGAGQADSITGTSRTYCCGGGGGGKAVGGAGGSAFGGNGACVDTETHATDAITPGSGGGGSYRDHFTVDDDLPDGGSGARGTVILSYPTPP